MPSLLHAPGPYISGPTVSTTVAAKILSLKFIEMSEVGADDLNPTGRPRLPVSDISVWVEKFSTMAAILIQRFPKKGPELLAYQALIVRCERNYRGSQWVAYDRAFRREALAAHDLNWSVPNPRLFQEAFTGRAKDIPRCSVCLDDDHTAESCPKNPQRHSSTPHPPPTHHHPPIGAELHSLPLANHRSRATGGTKGCAGPLTLGVATPTPVGNAGEATEPYTVPGHTHTTAATGPPVLAPAGSSPERTDHRLLSCYYPCCAYL